jgi:hypothetical protein
MHYFLSYEYQIPLLDIRDANRVSTLDLLVGVRILPGEKRIAIIGE